MLLKDWMRVEGLTDEAVAERIGGISPGMVRKLRFRVRGPSVRIVARIEGLSGGKVLAADLLPRAARRVRRVALPVANAGAGW